MSAAYSLTVGLEIHAELQTNTKMFCGCKNAPHSSEPNSNVCPICLAHPGTLPTPNEEAIRKLLTFGKAVGGTLATYSEFDRKNYFYPDIPKAYQISQYAYPFVSGGSLADVTLTRVHLEEDTARSQHEHGDYSLVDYNRAGVPLMELVTEPVITSAEQAGEFARELQLTLQLLELSTANMERGEMRVEANISVSKSDILGTKVEVKNLNSFRSVGAAIAFEYNRQVQVLAEGGTVEQETRGWDETKLRTYSQRKKERSEDYRYFPDPDLRKIQVSELVRQKPLSDEILRDMPDKKREKYENLGLTSNQIEAILAHRTLRTVLDDVVAAQPPLAPKAANYLLTDVASLVPHRDTVLPTTFSKHFATLLQMVSDGEINSRVAKDLLPKLVAGEVEPRSHAEANNLLQKSDDTYIATLVTQVVEENPEVVAEYRAGKEAALQYLVGQGMKHSRGSADPQQLSRALRNTISS